MRLIAGKRLVGSVAMPFAKPSKIARRHGRLRQDLETALSGVQDETSALDASRLDGMPAGWEMRMW